MKDSEVYGWLDKLKDSLALLFTLALVVVAFLKSAFFSTFALSLILIGAAYEMSTTGPDQRVKLFLFAVLCLAVFHLAFWMCRRISNDKTIRATDYIYLTLGLVGIAGVLEIQSSLVQLRVREIIFHHLTDNDYQGPGYCQPFDSDPLSREKFVRCAWQERIGKSWSQYDHPALKEALDSTLRVFPEGMPAPAQQYFGYAQSLYDDMEQSIFQYVETDPSIPLKRRLWAFYIICIGLTLRLSRVTAEILRWHMQSSERSQDRSVAPTI
jgi:hypothetical protein